MPEQFSSNETPPETEQKKSPNIEPDLDIAKRELEKLYSPEKSSIDVGLDVGKGIEKEPEILVDKSI